MEQSGISQMAENGLWAWSKSAGSWQGINLWICTGSNLYIQNEVATGPCTATVLGMVYDPGINLCMDSAMSDNHLCLDISFHHFILQFTLILLFVIFVFFTATTLMWHPVTLHFICHLFSCHVFLAALCFAFCTPAFSGHKVTGDSHYFSWEGIMSILIRYSRIPFYFCFSFTSSTSSIHHYAPLHQHDCTWLHSHSLIWWTHVLQFTCFISILSTPNMHPPMVWPITSPCTTWSGTFYSFALDEPYAHFLVDHSYLTCLYLPFDTENLPIWVSPRIQI